MRLARIVTIVLCLLVPAWPLAAQTTTSSGVITGTVLDSTGAVVPGAAVTATNVDRNTSFETTTDNSGVFIILQLLPARYTLTVEKAGFRKYVQRDLILNLNARLSVGNITLEVGAVEQTVEVVAQGLRLQTESAARTGSIVGTQLQNIEVNGRSPLSLLRIVPGVVFDLNTAAAKNRLVGDGDININGARANSLNATINGVSVGGGGENGKMLATLSLDSLQEFNVLTSNYQAQYGKAAGGTIMYVTKSGGKDFHGSAYWYYRDKGLNAASWINNRDKTAKSNYHYNYFGYQIGGPVYIPGKFNTNKDKLFFFFSEEYQRQLVPEGERRITVPTALERQGDFSQSVDKSGNTMKYIRDPNATSRTCNASDTSGCFQDGGVIGKIPAGSQYAPGIALLNIFPAPNVTNPSAYSGRNYRSQVSSGIPRHERLIRLDSNLSRSWRAFGSYTWLVQDFEGGAYGPQGYSLTPNYPIGKTQTGVAAYSHPGYALSVNLTTTLNPTSTNEVMYGQAHHRVTVLPGNLADVTRAGTGLTGANAWPTPFPPYADWIPQFAFSGNKINTGPTMRTAGNILDMSQGGGAFSPFDSIHTILEIADNYTKVWNKHLIKAGIYMQRARKDQTVYAQTGGAYDFGDSSTNPYDTGFGFANAAAGVYTAFTQASNYLNGQYRYTNLEMYVQDTWKVTSRVTLDLGLRAYLIQPTFEQGLHTSTFSPSAYSSSSAVRLLWPCWVGGAKWACDYNNLGVGQTPQTPGADLSYNLYTPGTGTVGESALGIQKMVPNVGSWTNGILPAGQGINKYLMATPGIVWAPRVGFAIDLTGRGNLVLRAGAGAFYDRYQINEVLNTISNPPSVFSPTLYNGCLLAVGGSSPCGPLSLAGGLLSVSNLTALSYDGKIPVIYNFSAGIQAKLPYATVLDVSYVGSLGRQLIINRNINAIPYGAAFLAANQDPTKTGGTVPAGPYDGSKAYDSAFLRPYRGYGNITVEEFGSTSNYNSLQVSVDRRFAKGLFFGVAYTWSKCLGVGSADGAGGRIDSLRVTANYGPCGFDVRQNLTFNYVYNLPGVTGHGSLDNVVTRALLNGWQISGITVFRNAGPLSPGYTNSGSAYTGTKLTGTGDAGARVRLAGNPYAGTSDDPYDRLNVNAFAPPTSPSLGLESPVNYITPPGINAWDMSLQKNVPLKEKAHLEFRFDFFNAFNHTQFSGLNASPTFSCSNANCAGGTYTVTNLPYSAYNSDGTPAEGATIVNKTGFGTVAGVRSPRVIQLVVRFVF